MTVNHKPWMLIECKAGEVNLDEKVLYQVLRYNISMPATFPGNYKWTLDSCLGKNW
jgi:hypothetical protein